MAVSVGLLGSPPSSLAVFCAASCRALSSSSDTRSANASSGSRLGSTPNSKPPPSPLAPAPAAADAANAEPLSPSAPVKMGVLRRTSERITPGGIVTSAQFPSLLTASWNACTFALLVSSLLPNSTTSTATLFFFSFFPTLIISSCSAWTGLPEKMTMRCLWFLFCRCFKTIWATWTLDKKLHSPSNGSPCMAERTFPRSGVRVTSTRGEAPPMVSTPTAFSAFCCVLAPVSRLTASDWACMRVGA
mmetsp:Transcript_8009/g.49473  ORF Transcript_8009/g.49473 Transcript_8009/m.49473 type:complete len:246 (+) Transcript_8009:1575-2312(+)